MSNKKDSNENISFCIDDASETTCHSELYVSQLLSDSVECEDYKTSLMLNYQLNMTVKQLLQICEYYGIAKGLKTNKKDDIICTLVAYEEDVLNYEIVSKRRLMWFYVGELKNDKFMKRFVIW